MRSEIREVLVEQEIFIASDGKEFTDEDECGEYEVDLLAASLEGKCYSENYKAVNFDESIFVNLTTDTDVDNFKQLSDYHGLSWDGIGGPGIYVWVNDDSWINLDKIISNIRGGLTNDQT